MFIVFFGYQLLGILFLLLEPIIIITISMSMLQFYPVGFITKLLNFSHIHEYFSISMAKMCIP